MVLKFQSRVCCRTGQAGPPPGSLPRLGPGRRPGPGQDAEAGPWRPLGPTPQPPQPRAAQVSPLGAEVREMGSFGFKTTIVKFQ